MYKNWIHEDQVMPLVELLAQFCGYDFEASDADAVSYGIKATKYEDGKWFGYPIVGRIMAGLQLSRDVGTDVIHFEVQSAKEVEAKLDTALYVLNHMRTRLSRQPSTGPNGSPTASSPSS